MHCAYWHPVRDLKSLVHGDDFATSGEDEDLAWLKEQMDGRFEMKTQMVGSKHAKEGKVLNRVIRITEHGWEYEADQRHGELIVEMMGLKEANGVNSPGEEPKAWEEEEDEEELEDQMARDYRGVAARANYVSMDRADIQFATKEVCRGMARPKKGDKKKMKRLAKYL